jgi:hypothetical protein
LSDDVKRAFDIYIVDMTADFPVFMTRYEAIENASLALWINHYLVRTFP